MAPKSRVAPSSRPSPGGKQHKKPKPKGGASNRAGNLVDVQAQFTRGRERREAREEKRKAKLRKRKEVGLFDSLLKMLSGRKEVELNAKSMSIARALMLTGDDIQRIKASYDAVDVDGAGEMDFDEFFEMLGEPRTPFTDAVFTLIDNVENTGIEPIPARERKEMELEDGPGTALHVRGFLTFNDFFQVVCTFAMYGEDDILLFGFNAFDQENTGVINETELRVPVAPAAVAAARRARARVRARTSACARALTDARRRPLAPPSLALPLPPPALCSMALCLIVNNDFPRYPDNFKLALATFDKNTDGMMDFNQFKTCHQRFPLTLFPAFRFQDRIRAKVLGTATWIDVSRRIEVEKKRETYRRAHDGAEMPLSPLEQLCALLSRKREDGERVKKPTSMAETAEKKAALTANKQADTKVVKAAETLRREGRGAKSVGVHKTGKLQKREAKGVGGGGF